MNTLEGDPLSPTGDPLAHFPLIRPLDDTAVLASETDLVSAINSQNWSRVADKQIEKPTEVPSCRSQHPLLSAVIGGEGNPFLLRRLFKAGYSPKSVDQVSGWPFFLIAVYLGRLHAVHAFLEAGTSPNTSVLLAGKHKTALGIAIAVGNVDMANLLLLSGANFYKVSLRRV